ncbi:MAG: response regulator [Pseudomonadota bacterium]
MKKRILFVDDEKNILQGLRRTLRSQRHQWEMFFAESGSEALIFLKKNSFDAIVSDMRMPNMDGAQLLDEVKRLYPDIVRFVLSGHSDQELIMRSVGPSHQYLAKPCEVDVLISCLEEAFTLQSLLSSERLRTVVSGMSSLPSLPDIYQSVTEEISSNDGSIYSVGKLVVQDPSMSAKVLQLVNSAYFGISRSVTSPTEAANFLGLDILKALILSEGVFSQFDKATVRNLSLCNIKNRSMLLANRARKISQIETDNDTLDGQAFLSGLLHDIGSLILASNMPKEYIQSRQLVTELVSISDAEKQVFGATHAEIGAYILGLWGLDNDVVAAVAYHHSPESNPSLKFSALTALFIADSIIIGSENKPVFPNYALAYIEQLGLAERIPKWLSICRSDQSEDVA